MNTILPHYNFDPEIEPQDARVLHDALHFHGAASEHTMVSHLALYVDDVLAIAGVLDTVHYKVVDELRRSILSAFAQAAARQESISPGSWSDEDYQRIMDRWLNLGR